MEVTEDEIVEEVKLAGDIRGEINALLISLTNLLINKTEDPTSNSGASLSGFQCNDESPSLHVKLPKLETKKFSRRIEEWQEFWNSFESANLTNMKLSSVDNFFYFYGLLLGGARTSIIGLDVTSANYEALNDDSERRPP